MPASPLTPPADSWLWTCRAGFDAHLFEELVWAGARPKRVAEALMVSERRPERPPAFARYVFRVHGVLPQGSLQQRALQAAQLLARQPGPPVRTLQVFTPDTDSGNLLSNPAEQLLTAVKGALSLPEESGHESQGRIGVLCVAPGLEVVGSVEPHHALSWAPGGRHRMRREASAPSRAAMKLEEALDGLSVEPGKGEQCVDLGAAPGGWTQRLVARGARVVAVDPARLMEELTRHRLVKHVQESAFHYAPEEPVDWLFCDMAWRPLEVAQLLAKWGRRGWATQLVANFKLPMKDKNPVLFRIRHVLEVDGGWTSVNVRQLYHDRDEVTVTARHG